MAPEDLALLAVDDANAAGSTQWRLVGRLAGGSQSGAWRLESGDGGAAVLKLTTAARWAEQVLRARRSVARVRAGGYPTPAWLATGRSTGFGYQIQAMVPGRPLEVIGVAEAAELIRVLELQAGLDPDPGRSWSDVVAEDVTTRLPALRAGAAAAGPAGAVLVQECDRLLSGLDRRPQLPAADMVHGDFRPANVLFDHGSVAGVVDIEAIGSGTRVLDYATLLDHDQLDDAALEVLVAAAVQVAGPDVLRACFARVALDLARFVARATPTPPQQLAVRVGRLADRVGAVDRLSRR